MINANIIEIFRDICTNYDKYLKMDICCDYKKII